MGCAVSDNKRFSLDAIDDNKAALEAAKNNDKGSRDHSMQKIVALTNLPFLIAVVAYLLWKFL
ncbi:hypothetical protein WG78_05080 [Amantichitinum ursilacus]|uniref:Uncharacterized protein n=1 Tax=Amantichitinum ursilacus TaxID=857265 RepID=A0A0N0GPT2_9NEIS|nr:hypothetical protein WG78_05080 [Amantichitinum ursilacus]